MSTSPDGVGVAVDAHVTYPCYKSLDEFIDVGWLSSLDGYVAERIRSLVSEDFGQGDYQVERITAGVLYARALRSKA
jgi:hypothetical protein